MIFIKKVLWKNRIEQWAITSLNLKRPDPSCHTTFGGKDKANQASPHNLMAMKPPVSWVNNDPALLIGEIRSHIIRADSIVPNLYAAARR
jgi:hypothetical protein